MAVHRRRQQLSSSRRLIPETIAALSAAILFFFVCFSFLAPSPVEHDHVKRAGMRNKIYEEDKTVVSRVQESGGAENRNLWSSKYAKYYHGCSNASKTFPKASVWTHPNRYLGISTSGGLNQQRTGITDAVVAARILNATLVVPKLDAKSFWKDVSKFSDIFDVDWFIKYLEKDVKVIIELPQRRGRVWNPPTMRIPRKCNEQCYISRLVPVLNKKQAVQLTKFDYRLSNRLDTDLQKLRCRVNYHALRFTDPIRDMGSKLVRRMRMKSKHYVALHLRYEPDMLAFSGCYYGGGDKERSDLGKIRRRWKTLHSSNPDRERRQGRCPLTPEEVGLLLRALGYDRETHIYVASGEVYGGEETLAPLKALFPNFYSKDSIASPEELEPFSSFSSRMAALDFIVCDESDVFVTNNNGNMAKILAGRRRYFGHKPTIRPNAKKLYRLFLNRHNTTWEEFSSKVGAFQKGFMGEPREVRPGRGVFHENPSACICEDSDSEARKETEEKLSNKEDYYDVVAAEDRDANDDVEFSDREDEDDSTSQQKVNNETSFEDFVPELEEMLSD